MTTASGGNEVFRPTPIQFEDKYDVTKMRRLALDVNNISNRLAALTVTSTNTSIPSGGTAGQVLTKITTASGLATGWANVPFPSSFPYGQLTGVPTVFAPSQHLIANTTQLGPTHTIIAGGPGQVLKATGTAAAKMDFLNYADLGDVDLSNLQGGYVPTWSSAANKWQMQPAGGLISGTSGLVLTGQGPGVSAIFLPIPQPTFPATGVGGAQWGIYPQSVVPMKNTAGTAAYSQLNIPLISDSLLGGDGAWHALSDIEISWIQISDIPYGAPVRTAPLTTLPATGATLAQLNAAVVQLYKDLQAFRLYAA